MDQHYVSSGQEGHSPASFGSVHLTSVGIWGNKKRVWELRLGPREYKSPVKEKSNGEREKKKSSKDDKEKKEKKDKDKDEKKEKKHKDKDKVKYKVY